MDQTFEVYLDKNLLEGNIENPELYISATGWYSEAVMAIAMRVKHDLFKLNLSNPIQNTLGSLRRIFQPGVLGIIVNQKNAHWVGGTQQGHPSEYGKTGRGIHK